MSNQTVKTWLARVECIPAKLGALDAERAAYEEAADKAQEVFNSLTCHPLAPEVMRLHWLAGLPWWKVGNALGYSTSRVKEIQALCIDELSAALFADGGGGTVDDEGAFSSPADGGTSAEVDAAGYSEAESEVQG